MRTEAFDNENQLQYGVMSSHNPELTCTLRQSVAVLNQRLNGPLALGFQAIKVGGHIDIASRYIARQLATTEMSQ